MINKIGYKLLLALLFCYALTLAAYLFLVVNVLSHKSCVPILIFAFLGIAIDYVVLVGGNRFKSRLGTVALCDISIITLFYTLMQFLTVLFARNILKPWQYTLFQSLFFALYLFSVLPILLSLNKNK